MRYTVGDKAKVPITVHTLGSKEWEAIGQILVLGFKTEGYFPVLRAQCWITKCIYGGDMDEGELVQAFPYSVSASCRPRYTSVCSGKV